MKVLFVGGPWDRKIHEVDDPGKYFDVHTTPEFPTRFYRSIDPNERLSYVTVHYRLFNLGNRIYVYLLEGMDVDDMMERLIQSYAFADYKVKK